MTTAAGVEYEAHSKCNLQLRHLRPFFATASMKRQEPRGSSQHACGYLCVSLSVALLLVKLGSVTPFGAVTVAVSESVPFADGLIVPVAM
jgi:hypothetical protein